MGSTFTSIIAAATARQSFSSPTFRVGAPQPPVPCMHGVGRDWLLSQPRILSRPNRTRRVRPPLSRPVGRPSATASPRSTCQGPSRRTAGERERPGTSSSSRATGPSMRVSKARWGSLRGVQSSVPPGSPTRTRSSPISSPCQAATPTGGAPAPPWTAPTPRCSRRESSSGRIRRSATRSPTPLHRLPNRRPSGPAHPRRCPVCPVCPACLHTC